MPLWLAILLIVIAVAITIAIAVIVDNWEDKESEIDKDLSEDLR